jgi:hypothetical protein
MNLIEGKYYYYYYHHHHHIFIFLFHNGLNSPWTRLNYDIDEGYDDDDDDDDNNNNNNACYLYRY